MKSIRIKNVNNGKEIINCFENPEGLSLLCTNVPDITGKLIFEGDIVVPTKFKDIPNLVKYISGGFYRVKKHGERIYINPLGTCELKIIGNIYENSDLVNVSLED